MLLSRVMDGPPDIKWPLPIISLAVWGEKEIQNFRGLPLYAIFSCIEVTTLNL